ncbi:CoB--CoM heterodisulfide reductase iron-sulfur subunit B family protein [Moorella sp. Hama-1]|uniref:CoB--CoM heterodisulfide reductase iron-sulfur subunit B family protein n=1 Tax=Moorella sp. Hama-1 TaxID=2138101 RepID=UPI000D643FB7|nr:CoB--CoM heterodisulfide reductase iron-sulfur subunit B family protein [Moorella sp. Hama-1]BCV21274.1 disulfide reductase [Moorella sp. Hama-1]
MRLSYYPGCSLHSTAAEFSASTEDLFQALGVELRELEDWCCCGATSGHSLSGYLSHALPLHNLVLAEAAGDDLLVPCAACYNSLKAAQTFMAAGGEEAAGLNRQVAAALGREYQGQVRVRHVIEVLADPQVENLIKDRLKKSLAGMPLASYYGCLLTRPPKVASFEINPEQPQLMDRLLRLAGAMPVSWSHKNECCGASLAIPQPRLVEGLVGKIVAAARRAGAKAIVTACPLCQTNLDSRQVNEEEALPVFFITEIIGLALGLNTTPWLKKHLVDPRPLLQQQGRAVS